MYWLTGGQSRSRVRAALSLCQVGVADEVPRRVDERVHRVRLPARQLPAPRALDGHPVLGGGERRASLRQVLVHFGQDDRQLVVRDGGGAVLVAVDDQDGTAPVALAREPPSRAGGSRSSPRPRRVPRASRRSPGLRGGPAVERARVDEHLVVGARMRPFLEQVAVGRASPRCGPGPVRRGRTHVALVVRRDGHDRACAMLHQHVVGDPDRDLLAVDGVDRVAAGEDAVLLLLLALDRGAAAAAWRTYSRTSSESLSCSTSGCSGASTEWRRRACPGGS